MMFFGGPTSDQLLDAQVSLRGGGRRDAGPTDSLFSLLPVVADGPSATRSVILRG
jgi:hypothetical protein